MKKPTLIQRFSRYSLAAALLPALLAGCIDNAYDLDNVSAEIRIGGETLVLPLGILDRKELSELIDPEDIDGLNADSGVYVFNVKSEEPSTYDIEDFYIDPIQIEPEPIDPVKILNDDEMPSAFSFAGTTADLAFAYPDLSVSPTFDPFSELSVLNLSSTDVGAGYPLPELPRQTLYIGDDDGAADLSFTIDIPEQVQRLKTLYFGGGDYGSPIEIVIAQKGLYDVSSDARMNLNLVFPENYVLKDANGTTLSPANVFSVSDYEFGNARRARFVVYLYSMELPEPAGSQVAVNDVVYYNGDFSFQPLAGETFNGSAPEFSLSMNPVYGDVEVVTNDIVVDESGSESEVPFTIDNISKVKNIDYIGFYSDITPVELSISGLAWLPDDITDVELTFSEEFQFSSDSQYYDAASRTVTAPLGTMRNGVILYLEKLYFPRSEDGEGNVKNGTITVVGKVKTKVKDIPAGTDAMLSELVSPTADAVVKAIIAGCDCYVDYENTEMEPEENTYPFDFSERGLNINTWVSVPEQIKKIESLEFVSAKDGGRVKATINMELAQGSSLPVNEVDIDFGINFKKMIKPSLASGFGEIVEIDGDNWYTVSGLNWDGKEKLTLAELYVDDLTNIPDPEEGPEGWAIHLQDSFGIRGEARVPDDAIFNGKWDGTEILFTVEADDIKVTEVTGLVDIQEDLDTTEFEIEIPEEMDNLRIGDLAISPIIRLDVTNPFGVPVLADLTVTPYDADGFPITENILTISDSALVIDEFGTPIVISTAARRNQFGSDVRFVEFDVTDIVRGEIPAKITLDAKVFTDAEHSYVVDLSKDSYDVVYEYSVDLPLEFGKELDIEYTQTVDQSLSDLPDAVEGVSFKSAGIVADFKTTIPLDLDVDVHLLDGNGAELPIKFSVGDGIIHGHNSKDPNPAESRVYVNFDLGGGSLAQLRDLEQIRFTIGLRSPARNEQGEVLSPLSPDQMISAKLKIRIDGGISADLKSFFESKSGEIEDEE